MRTKCTVEEQARLIWLSGGTLEEYLVHLKSDGKDTPEIVTDVIGIFNDLEHKFAHALAGKQKGI